MDGFDAAVARLARRQHGVFSFEQVAELGGSRTMVQRRLASGRWDGLASGVYRMAGVPTSWESDLMAATLLTQRSAVSDAPAAALHGLTDFPPVPPEVTTTEGRCHASPLAVVHRRERYRATRVQGIRVGTIDQVVGDLAGTVPFERLDRAVSDALAERRVHLGRLEDLSVERSGARGRGAVDLRRLVERRSAGEPVPESVLEEHLWRLLDDPRVPPVEFQASLPWDPGGPGRVDAFIRYWMLVVEADGRRWHARVDDLAHDQRRVQAGQAVGVETVRFSYTDLTADADVTLALLLQIGAQRERLLYGDDVPHGGRRPGR